MTRRGCARYVKARDAVNRENEREVIMVFQNKYSYRPGFNYKCSPQVVGETLDKLSQTTEVTAKSFLDISRPEDSPTHGLFEWDDAIAAEQYRLQISGCVIRSIEVTRIQVEETTSEVSIVEADEKKDNQTFNRAYVNVNKSAGFQPAKFVPVHQAMSNEDMRKQVLQNALDELNAYKRKYYMLSELSKVFDAIQEVEYELHGRSGT